MLDANLTFNEHNVSTVFSCMSRLGQVNRVKHVVEKNSLIIVINALVLVSYFIAPLFGATPPKLIWTKSKL